MQFDAELLLLALAPVFLVCIGAEAWHFARTRRAARLYSWPDTLCNAALALMHQGADKLAAGRSSLSEQLQASRTSGSDRLAALARSIKVAMTGQV